MAEGSRRQEAYAREMLGSLWAWVPLVGRFVDLSWTYTRRGTLAFAENTGLYLFAGYTVGWFLRNFPWTWPQWVVILAIAAGLLAGDVYLNKRRHWGYWGAENVLPLVLGWAVYQASWFLALGALLGFWLL